MAEPKGRGGKRRTASRTRKVIDVSDDPAAEPASQGDAAAADGDGDGDGDDVQEDLIDTAPSVIDIDPDETSESSEPAEPETDAERDRDSDDEDLIKPAKRERGGSLARRDPLAAYMRETR